MSKILIVDDQPFNVDLLEQELEALDYQTTAAYDGQQALDRVAEDKPDLILLDVMMPVLDGFTVCKILKGDPETMLIPIIIMTALDDIDDRIQGIEAGADDFLTKPVNERELKARIETALRLKQAMEGRIDDAGKVGRTYEKFVPEGVKRRVRENPDRPELDKRDEDASVLFLDIVAYTRLSEKMSPSALIALVERYFSAFLDPLHEYGGDISESSGDGLMVLFQHEDPQVHPQRAIEAAFAVFEETCRLNSESEEPPIELHMGINSGSASVGSTRYEAKSGTRWIFTADGFVVNLAARLASVAQAGELCVGPETAQRIAARWELDDLGLKTMKNVAEPTRVYKVLARKKVDKPSVMVLPFDNPDGDPDQRLVCDGFTEDLINDLSKVEGLFVIAPNSSFTYSPTAEGTEVCEQLQIRFVVDGSAVRSGSSHLVRSRLSDADGNELWTGTWEHELPELFAVRDQVARAIVAALGVTLTEDDEQRLSHDFTPGLDAWRHHLRGVRAYRGFTHDQMKAAIRRFDMALSSSPGYSRALAGKAKAHMLMFVNSWGDDPPGALQEAHRLARAAVEADPDEAEAYTALSAVLLWMNRHEDAVRAANWALQRDPNHSMAYVNLGSIHHYAGDHQLGLSMMQHAMRLDPNCPPVYLHFVAQNQYGCQLYDEAITSLNRRLTRSPGSDISRVLLAACYGQTEEPARGREQWDEALAINPDYSLTQKRLALPYRDPADFEHIVAGLAKAGVDVSGV
jgi:DNA-binding response OmpR family regulator/TolB-like protein